MDLVSSCKDKLAYFRIKELKDVLTELGLSKQGKKQDLVDRILGILSDERVSRVWAKKNAVTKEDVAKLVDDTYRKMRVSGVADLASKSRGSSESPSIKTTEETASSYQVERIRCLCASSLQTDSMIKCEEYKCSIWQHIKCVVIPEKPGAPPNPPEVFYCEICRLNRADPFWMTIGHPLYPVKLNIVDVGIDGANPSLGVERTFQMTRADKDLLAKPEYDVQAWCMLLSDKGVFRMHWPQYADLQINGLAVRAINRPGSQLLGANGRDDGPIITPYTRDGINKISLTGCDSRIFCLGVRIVKRRNIHQVLSMIPKEAEGEPFEDALARVRRCVGGGAATENADSDSDIEVVADCIPVNLRCPMSGLRMKVAGRFKPCVHMGCFDLEVFVEMNQRSRKWQCPICLKNYSLENIIIDPYFNRITSKLRNCGEDVTEIEVKPDGSWRAKSDGDRKGLGELGLWHLPDGTISTTAAVEIKPKAELKSVKQEVGSDSHGHLRLGMKKNQKGCWEFNRSGGMQGMSPAIGLEHVKDNGQSVVPMSSSATGSARDCEDASVNQDGGGNLEFSTVPGYDFESVSLNIDPRHEINNQRTPPAAGNTEIIVLSDSEGEMEPQMSSGAVQNNAGPDTGGVSGVSFPAPPHGISDLYCANPALANGGSSSLDLYGTNEDDFGINMWQLPTGSQGGAGFQLFGSHADASDGVVDVQHGSRNCSSMNGFIPTTDTATGPGALAPTSTQYSNINDGLVDNALAYNGDDPSLQIFLPTKPSEVSAAQPDVREHLDVSSGIRAEDWFSLRLGNGGRAGNGEVAASNGFNSRQQVQSDLQSDFAALDSLVDTATALLDGLDGKKSGKTSRERSEDSPFTFPRQRRSVRPRLYLSINSESE